VTPVKSIFVASGFALSLAFVNAAVAQNNADPRLVHPAEGTPGAAAQDAKDAAAKQGVPDTRRPVKTVDDLPRRTYKIEGKASEFILTDEPFKAFVDAVRKDAEDDLKTYRIEDASTLQGYYTLLQQISMIQIRWDDAIGYANKVRDLETKEARKLMAGQMLGALVAAKRATGKEEDAAFRAELDTRIRALPWNIVRDEVTQARGRAQIITRDLLIGQLKGQLDPIVTSTNGEISGDIARTLVSLRATIDHMLPKMPAVDTVYGKIIADNAVEKKDIWADRALTLAPTDNAMPVVVAIWDSGVDVSLYPNRLWVNTKETANGKDDDNNGFVDDINGIAFDLDSRPTPELLHPLTDLRSNRKLAQSHMKGIGDLQASIDSPEAANLRSYVSQLQPADVTPFLEDLGLYGNYSHGTHVTGIAAEGNPFIRILAARITFDFREIPTNTPSIDEAKRIAESYAKSVAYFKAGGVRVVNMSWGGGLKDVESALEAKNAGGSPEERADLARRIYTIQREGFEAALKSAPEILFIAAAGNSDDDNEFTQMFPSGVNLPNLITVGAVDQAGTPTGFTSFGRNVTLYANGFEVNSDVPGGDKMKFSGTSMAAPNAANLAAKLIALNPKLTPTQTIDLIRKGATEMPGYTGRFLINPKASAALLKDNK
jgi:subtilisin family serine protease